MFSCNFEKLRPQSIFQHCASKHSRQGSCTKKVHCCRNFPATSCQMLVETYKSEDKKMKEIFLGAFSRLFSSLFYTLKTLPSRRFLRTQKEGEFMTLEHKRIEAGDNWLEKRMITSLAAFHYNSWGPHSVWKSQKKSHSTLRAKRATFTFEWTKVH